MDADIAVDDPAGLAGRSALIDHAIVRALSTGAAPGLVIEQAAGAIAALCPGRGVAVWYRRADGTATVRAAGIRPDLAMIAEDAESSFWQRAHTVRQPNYAITFRDGTPDRDIISVWCIPASDGPLAGDLVVVAVGQVDDDAGPAQEARTALEHIARLVAVSLDRQRLLDRLEDAMEHAEAMTPHVATGLTPTRGDAEEPAETVVVFIHLDELDEIEALHGHRATDALSEEIVDRLSHTVRPGDTVARLGRTEFALRCYLLTAIQAEAIASRVLNDLWAPVVTQWETTRLRPRIGLARAAVPAPLSRLLDDAERAVHLADSLGRDWMWVDDELPPPVVPAAIGHGFGAGPGPDPQSVPGRLADSAPGSPE